MLRKHMTTKEVAQAYYYNTKPASWDSSESM